MRAWAVLLGVWGVWFVGIAGRASAASCYVPGPQFAGDLDAQDWPIDAHPWTLAHCGDAEPTGCVLVGVAATVPVTPSPRPAFCDDVAESDRFGAVGAYVRHYVPAGPPPEGTSALRCEHGETPLSFLPEPASPPRPVEVLSAEHLHRDTLCCDNEGVLALELRGLFEPYLTEGGYIEVRYEDGQTLPAVRDGSGQANQVVELLPTGGPIEVTPVAADGERGPTVRVERADISGALDKGCAIGGGASRTLWLLLPLVYVVTRRRRRM